MLNSEVAGSNPALQLCMVEWYDSPERASDLKSDILYLKQNQNQNHLQISCLALKKSYRHYP